MCSEMMLELFYEIKTQKADFHCALNGVFVRKHLSTVWCFSFYCLCISLFLYVILSPTITKLIEASLIQVVLSRYQSPHEQSRPAATCSLITRLVASSTLTHLDAPIFRV